MWIIIKAYMFRRHQWNYFNQIKYKIQIFTLWNCMWEVGRRYLLGLHLGMTVFCCRTYFVYKRINGKNVLLLYQIQIINKGSVNF